MGIDLQPAVIFSCERCRNLDRSNTEPHGISTISIPPAPVLALPSANDPWKIQCITPQRSIRAMYPLGRALGSWECRLSSLACKDGVGERSVILLDSFSWPATWPAYPSAGPSPWIAPNLDLHVRFHHDARADDWLLFEARAELAAEGLIGTSGTVWSPDGKLIAAGSSQLFCRPRPERFR